jgi:hypothetical protein
MSKTLTDSDFRRAADRLRCDVPSIRAVAHVESRGQGFYADGFPVILFERHMFRRFTRGAYDQSHPHLSGPAGNYGKAGQNQRNKFNEAFRLSPNAAMKACSWGKFQIMGFNHRECGFESVGDFVDAMKESEGRQLDAFCEFILSTGLADELRRRDWKEFARRYNGAGYAKNKYDAKMARAYATFSRQVSAAVPQQSTSEGRDLESPLPLPDTTRPPIITEDAAAAPLATDNAGAVASPSSSTTTETKEIQTTQESGTITETVNEQPVNEPAVVTEPEPQGFMKKLGAGIGSILGGTIIYDSLGKFSGIQLSTQAVYVILFVLFLGFLGFCVWAVLDVWKKNSRTRIEAEANTAINRKNITWVKPE